MTFEAAHETARRCAMGFQAPRAIVRRLNGSYHVESPTVYLHARKRHDPKRELVCVYDSEGEPHTGAAAFALLEVTNREQP